MFSIYINRNILKILMVMKLTTFFFLISILSVAARGYSQHARLNLSLQNASIQELFQEIEKQSEFNFFYKDDQIDVNKMVSIEADNSLIGEVLNEVFENSGVSYTVVDKVIVITPRKEQQNFKVTGTVTASTGETLPGVNILVKGTETGTITGMDGKYSIEAPDANSVLVFSYVGYTTQEININGRSVIDITLEVSVELLEEVVAIGYGTVKKSDLTGAVASITQEDLGNQALTSIDQMMQGKAAGVEVVNSTGLPGSGASIKIRGVGTFYNTEPLFVIDGVQFTNSGSEQQNPLSLINTNDIESIEILKDASATAIYGSRAAANGVVIITTKRGKAGKPKITYDGYFGVASPWKKLDILNAEQYLDLISDIQLNANPSETQDSYFSNFPRLWQNGAWTNQVRQDVTDWQEEMFQSAFLTDQHLAVSGGSEKMTYNMSGGYSDMDGILTGYNYKRYTVRVATDFNPAKWLRFGQNINIGHRDTKNIPNGLFLEGLRMPPYSPVFDPNNQGGYAKVTTTDDLNDAYNPAGSIGHSDRTRKNTRILGNFYGELEPVKGLVYRISVGLDMSYESNYIYSIANQQGNLTNPSSLTEDYSYGLTPLIENTLTFSREFGVHSLTLMAGNSYRKGAKGRYVGLEGRDFANEEIRVLSVVDNPLIRKDASGAWESALLAYFGRVNYIFANKYLVTATLRTDASPNFDPESRWATFPSFSLGWKIHEESFMNNMDFISQLKVRGGWGQSGRDIGGLRYYATLHSNGVGYVFGTGNTFNSGVTVLTPPSTGIKWETSTTTNVGIDLGLANNRITLTADYFTTLTEDILVPIPIPPSVGFGLSGGENSSPTVNAANVKNSGVEFTVGWRNNIGDFHYSINANAAFINNEVTSMGDGEPINMAGGAAGYSLTRTEVGYPIGYFYGFVVDKVYSTQAEVDADNADAPDGVYQANAAPGDIRFMDINGRDENGELTGIADGKVDDDDRKMIGKPIPDATYGITLAADYKGFDFALAIQGIAGVEIYNNNGYWFNGMTRPFNSTTDVLDRWKQEGDVTDMPRAMNGDPARNTRVSTRYVENGSYMRLKTLTLGYTLSQSALGRIANGGISYFRVYLTAQNLLTITEYSGFDPEISAMYPGDYDNYNLRRGIDNGQYPQPRSFMIGFQLGF